MKIFHTLSRTLLLVLLTILLALIFVLPISADGPGYTLDWWTVDGGGDSTNGGSGYTLAGTAGQPDSAVWQGGGYTLVGGFWGGAATAATTLPDGESVYLPLILKAGPTGLSIFNDNTGGNVTFSVVGTGVSCTVPNNTTQLCGTFTPGTYTVNFTAPGCPGIKSGSAIKTYGSGSVTTRVFCQ